MLVLAAPVVGFDRMFADLIGYDLPHGGWTTWVAPVLGTVMYVWGGRPFLTGAVDAATAFSDQDRRSWQSAESKAARAETARRLAFLTRPGRTQAQACLQFPLAFPGVSTVIAGSKSLEHMRENAAASAAPALTPAELAGIDRALGRITATP